MLVGTAPGRVRMDAEGQPHTGPDSSDLARALALLVVIGSDDHERAGHSRGHGPLDHVPQIARELFAREVAMTIDHEAATAPASPVQWRRRTR